MRWKFVSTHYLRVRLVLNVPIKSLHTQNYCSATLIGTTSLRVHQHEIGTHIIKKLLCTYVYYSSTGWGKITFLNFKVNNKKTIRDIKILFLDSETTTWEILNHIVLKIVSCKWWPLLSIHCCWRVLIFRITLVKHIMRYAGYFQADCFL